MSIFFYKTKKTACTGTAVLVTDLDDTVISHSRMKRYTGSGRIGSCSLSGSSHSAQIYPGKSLLYVLPPVFCIHGIQEGACAAYYEL